MAKPCGKNLQIDRTTVLRAAVPFAVTLVLPQLLGLPGLLACVLLSWPFAAMLSPVWGWTAGAPVVGSCLALMHLLPDGLFPIALLWAACGLYGAYAKRQEPLRMLIRWAALSCAVVLTVLGALTLRYPGETAAGLAQEMVDSIAQSGNRDAVLMSAYDNGMASLEDESILSPYGAILGGLWLPAEDVMRLYMHTGQKLSAPGMQMLMYGAMQTGGAMPLGDRAAAELLGSLQTTLETMYHMYMPEIVISYVAFTSALCVLLPDEWKRRRGIGRKKEQLPAMDTWKLPLPMAVCAAFMYVPGVITWMTDDRIVRYACMLCTGAAAWPFMFQGAGLLAHWLKKHGTARTVRLWLALGLAVIFPQALEIMGMFDQILPLRKADDD